MIETGGYACMDFVGLFDSSSSVKSRVSLFRSIILVIVVINHIRLVSLSNGVYNLAMVMINDEHDLL